jgi:O-antigen ligase
MASQTAWSDSPLDQRADKEGAAPSQGPPPNIENGAASENRLASLVLFCTVSGAPLLFGSADSPAQAFWCIFLGLGLMLASPRHLQRGHLVFLGGAVVIVLGYAFVLHEQLAEAPWVASFHPIWSKASEVLGTPLKPSVSIVRYEPWYALGAPLINVMALILGLVVGVDRTRARQLLQVIAWSGAGYALYGIVAFATDPTMILWREKVAYTNVLTATFINRNTAALYFGSCAVVCEILLFHAVRRRLPPGHFRWKTFVSAIVTKPSRRILIFLAMFVLCLGAMFMTGSRAGVVLSLAAFVFAFVGYFRRDLPSSSALWGALAGGAAFAAILLQFLGERVSSRFEAQGLADGGRLETYRSTLRMIADFPWFGTGLGTFEWSYPAYRSSNISMRGVWDRAHSTPLEFASELGLPLTIAVAIGWLTMLVILIRACAGRRRDAIVPLASLIVALLALLHSLIDFSLQISGYSLVVFALLGVGLAQSLSDGPASSAADKGQTQNPSAAATARPAA